MGLFFTAGFSNQVKVLIGGVIGCQSIADNGFVFGDDNPDCFLWGELAFLTNMHENVIVLDWRSVLVSSPKVNFKQLETGVSCCAGSGCYQLSKQ